MNQKIVPVINDFKTFEKFLNSTQVWCVLMDFHVNFIEYLLKQLHAVGKKGIVHMDLVKGLQNDMYGAQFLCQKLHVDGIISTKPKSIETAIQNHVISILRVFLIDSRSLIRGAHMADALQPDYVEVLPGIIPGVVSMMHEHCNIPLIGGGLIKCKEDIEHCLSQGMCAITTSDLELCKWEDVV